MTTDTLPATEATAPVTAGDGALTALPRRDRAVLLTGLALLSIASWAYLLYDAHRMRATGCCCDVEMPDMQSWSIAELSLLFVMWAVMMVAMMAPTAGPMVLTFAAVNRRRRQSQRPYVPAGIFLLGYLLGWTLFSALATAAQWGLHAAALISPAMVSTSPIVGGVILIAAGLFQWTPLKHACLAHCRSPLAFIMTQWRDGTFGALRMGLRHGLFCLGCCWALMFLLFVTGVMNLLWVAILTAFVLLEKLAPAGPWVGRLAGLLMLGWGGWLIAGRLH